VKKSDNTAVTTVMGGPGMVIGCPICCGDAVRPVRLRCNPAGSMAAEVAIDADGVHVDKTANLCKGGGMVTLDLRCANGHTFMWAFALTHGRTILATVTDPPRCPEKAIWAN